VLDLGHDDGGWIALLSYIQADDNNSHGFT